MNITEMIKELEALREKHGDLPCVALDSIGLFCPIGTIQKETAESGWSVEGDFIYIGE